MPFFHIVLLVTYRCLIIDSYDHFSLCQTIYVLDFGLYNIYLLGSVTLDRWDITVYTGNDFGVAKTACLERYRNFSLICQTSL